MRKVKKIFIRTSVLILIIYLSKGFLYRVLFSYEPIGNRENYSLHDEMILAEINKKTKEKHLNVNQAVALALEITNDNLEFHRLQKSRKPDELIKSGKANCIGYSTLFNSILVNIFSTQQHLAEYQTIHKIGIIRFLGFNVHKLFNDKFFKDHDYNEIINIKTSERICVDPSLNEYLGIKTVSEK